MPEPAPEDLRRKIEERSLGDPFIRQALTRHAMGATSYEDAIGRALLSLSAAYEEQNRELFRLYRERP